jgi:hypothetical protein
MLIISSILFVLSIVCANIVISIYGIKAVLLVGFFLVPIDFVTRDNVHHHKGLVISLMIIGSLLSYWLSDPVVAIASGTAFAISMTVDYILYEKYNRVTSNIGASIADSIVFAFMAFGYFSWYNAAQVLVKILGSILYDILLPKEKGT